MVNKYMWQLYLKSDGKDIVKTFETNFSDPEYLSPDYAAFIKELRSTYTPMQWLIDDEYTQLENLYAYKVEDNKKRNNKENPDKELLYDSLIGTLKQINGSEDKAFSAFIYDIAFLTTDLTICAPELYIPYYFRFNFNVLQIIADAFDIELPQLPKKSDYNARFMYYAELCNALHSFREQNGWTPYELFSFLYDFAPKYIGGTSSYIISDLPEPKGAYFIGGSKDDIFLSDSEDEITIWQCSPETKVGDMIVMYLRSPVSAVDSVWRSCSLGFVDPFFYYYKYNIFLRGVPYMSKIEYFSFFGVSVPNIEFLKRHTGNLPQSYRAMLFISCTMRSCSCSSSSKRRTCIKTFSVSPSAFASLAGETFLNLSSENTISLAMAFPPFYDRMSYRRFSKARTDARIKETFNEYPDFILWDNCFYP